MRELFLHGAIAFEDLTNKGRKFCIKVCEVSSVAEPTDGIPGYIVMTKAGQCYRGASSYESVMAIISREKPECKSQE